MAEIILKRKIKLAGIEGVRVSSAGICANEGDKISKNSFRALKEMGYVPYGFKAKRLTEDKIKKADIVICMTLEHKSYLKKHPNVYAVSEIAPQKDISDPYGKGYDEYVKTSHEIEDLCNYLVCNI